MNLLLEHAHVRIYIHIYSRIRQIGTRICRTGDKEIRNKHCFNVKHTIHMYLMSSEMIIKIKNFSKAKQKQFSGIFKWKGVKDKYVRIVF